MARAASSLLMVEDARSRTGLTSCPPVSQRLLQCPPVLSRRPRHVLSCPPVSAGFRECVTRLRPPGARRLTPNPPDCPVSTPSRRAAVGSNHLLRCCRDVNDVASNTRQPTT